MNIPAWHIIQWPVVELTIDELMRISNFELVGHNSCRDGHERRFGNTFWSAEAANQRIGLVWEWSEVHPNVIVMKDPMSVMSNVAIKEFGYTVHEADRLLYLNNAVYQLPWQKRVTNNLRSEENSNRAAMPMAA